MRPVFNPHSMSAALGTAVLGGVALLTVACQHTSGTRITAEQLAQLEAQGDPGAVTEAVLAQPLPEATPAAAAPQRVDDDPSSEDYLTKSREFDGRQRKLARRREDHARDFENLADEQAQLAIQHESERASDDVARTAAERELRIATEQLEHFRGVERDRRLRENALEVGSSYDRLLETREELAQLELMYADADLGDAAAEIVVNRSRRRLTRAEERHGLREERSADLREIELPRREQELEAAVQAKQVAHGNALRKLETADFARRLKLRALDGKAMKLQRELADVEREEGELAQDRRRWEQKLAEQPLAANR